jgi:nucleoside-diphosphate kinase
MRKAHEKGQLIMTHSLTVFTLPLAHESTACLISFLLDIMIKPDGVQRGLVGEIIKRFEAKGYKLVAMKLCAPGVEHMTQHYIDLKEKKFFPGLITYMTSGPVVGMVWEGKNAVLEGRKMLGATMPSDSTPGSIRGDLCIEVGRNICHGSDSVESANAEIALWFPEGICEWESCSASQLYES